AAGDPEGENKGENETAEDEKAVTETVGKNAAIVMSQEFDCVINAARDEVVALHREELGAAHGGEGQGLDEGEGHSSRNSDPELEQKLADDSFHKGDGEKNSDDGESGGDCGSGNFRGSVNG